MQTQRKCCFSLQEEMKWIKATLGQSVINKMIYNKDEEVVNKWQKKIWIHKNIHEMACGSLRRTLHTLVLNDDVWYTDKNIIIFQMECWRCFLKYHPIFSSLFLLSYFWKRTWIKYSNYRCPFNRTGYENFVCLLWFCKWYWILILFIPTRKTSWLLKAVYKLVRSKI